MPDDLTAAGALARLREEMLELLNEVVPAVGPAQAFALGGLHMLAMKAAGAAEAPLRFHERTPLYGNAATDDEPDACPHPPDSDLHFEADDGSGEWLCEGRPEGAVCSSCTEDGLPVAWPCPEYAAVLAALTGEGVPVAEAD